MCIREGLGHFQLYNHQIIHQEIQSEGLGNQKATVGQAEFDLALDPVSIQA